jgi:hypothetical protein
MGNNSSTNREPGSGGPGDPAGGKADRFRGALLRAATPARAVRIWRETMDLAEAGDVDAQRLFYDVLFGTAPLSAGGGDAPPDPAAVAEAEAVRDWAARRRAGRDNWGGRRA